jgi:hypothetical protein
MGIMVVILFLPLQKKFRQRFERNRFAFENLQHILPFDFSGFVLKSNHVAANFN